MYSLESNGSRVDTAILQLAPLCQVWGHLGIMCVITDTFPDFLVYLLYGTVYTVTKCKERGRHLTQKYSIGVAVLEPKVEHI